MADPVAIVGILSGASVAIGVPFINARLEQRRLEQQSLDARLTELRDLLDGAVQHLFKSYYILFEIGQERRKPASDREHGRLRQLGDTLDEQSELLGRYGLRVRLRTPAGTEVAERQDQANRIVLDYAYEYRRYLDSNGMEQTGPPIPPTEEAFRAIQALIREIRAYAGVVTPPMTARAS